MIKDKENDIYTFEMHPIILIVLAFVLPIPAIQLDTWVITKLTTQFFPNLVLPEKYQIMGGLLLISFITFKLPKNRKKTSTSIYEVLYVTFGIFLTPIYFYVLGVVTLALFR